MALGARTRTQPERGALKLNGVQGSAVPQTCINVCLLGPAELGKS
jgi:hypothetical protein